MEIPCDAGPAFEAPRREPIAWLEMLNRIVATLVEVPAALLVLAEVVVLLMGVTSRYVLHQPLVWSDELASILFLWLAMLGSIIAFQRGEHMRMTAIVGKLEPRARAFLDLVAIAAGVAFLAFVVHPAYEFAQDEVFVTTPAMGIVNSWRAAALPIGLGLMLLVGLLQIFRLGRPKDAALALGAVAVVVGGMSLLGGGAMKALGNWNLLLFFVGGVGALVLLGVPIAFSFGLATFGYISLTTNTPIDRAGRAHGRRHEPPHPSRRTAVRAAGPPHRDDRHRPCDGRLPGQPARACPRRTVLCADRRDVPGFGHLGFQGSRHGGRRTGALSRDAQARRQAGRPGCAAFRDRRADRDDPSVAGADHDRLRNGRLHRRAFHRRPVAGRRGGRHAGRARMVALPGREPCGVFAAPPAARSAGRS